MVWLGPLIAFAAIALYFAVFLNYPITRDVPWASLLMLAIALGVSALGFARSRRKLLAGGGLALTVFLGGFFVWYCYVFSYQLPSADRALDVGAKVPAVVLRDDRGQDVELAALSNDKLVLVFFRGHW